ncbi:MAG: molybdenum cofactor biosynthesis protein MoaE [Bacteroidetes bacterium]|nr:molybdenum cofactor biosynthesis protein MoaE [Bacteroidota bacterium]MDE2671469.1 molybdenum cofactor biosynthesis protein MoaE [Bacteroidota bacterium]
MAEKSNKRWVSLSKARLDVTAAYQFLQAPTAGGIALFIGTTRQWTDGHETTMLVYESYEPMALKEMHRLLDVALTRWPISRACILHRLGEVPLTEASVLVGVATAHRPEAFEACRFLTDQLKVQVPIWKQEHLTDGQVNWVEGNEPPETTAT